MAIVLFQKLHSIEIPQCLGISINGELFATKINNTINYASLDSEIIIVEKFDEKAKT